MNEELNKRLNEWASTKDIDYTDPELGIAWCFKWLVPKVETDNQCTVFLRLCSGEGWTKRGWMCSVSDTTPFKKIGFSSEGLSDPALALCLAIEEIIEADKK